ncbi:MAG: cytochrome c biogenesis CcdA family protein [Acidimicrobiia bacterium]
MDNPSLIAAVFFGAASFISPCVLPLLPGYLSLMSGYSLQELSEGKAPTRQVVISTALFVAGFTAVFVALGASATSLSRWLLSDGGFIRVIAGWTVVAMGAFIAVTALWNPRILLPIMRERRVEISPRKFGKAAPPVMGAAFAFGWTPCIGPFLAAAFAVAGNSETVGRGMLVLLFYSLGLGIPFLASALVMTKAFNTFNWLKRHLKPINVASGVLLMLFGLLLVTNQVTELSRFFTKLLDRLGLDELATV